MAKRTRLMATRSVTTDEYFSWLTDLFVLLDRIDMENDNPVIEDLLRQRFQIAEKHGATVVWGEKVSGAYN